MNFNPRSPDGERHGIYGTQAQDVIFQSTLPGWGATDHLESKCQEPEISIHAPRMGSDRAPQHGGSHRGISIHAPRMGSDAARQDDVHGRAISIHAPRMGSDPQSYTIAPIPPISIHAPRMGSDLRISCAWVTVSRFQSTLPGWGATCRTRRGRGWSSISIHAPRMGSDVALVKTVHLLDSISIHAPRMGSDTVSDA